MDQNGVTLIFPHQLFKHHPQVKQSRPVYLVEETLFFNQYTFNKKKLVLHRASMRFYADELSAKKVSVNYIEANNTFSDVRKLIAALARQGIKQVYYVDTADNWLEARLNSSCAKHDITLTRQRSPNFLNSADDVADFFDQKQTYFQTDFYTNQRRQRNILLEPDGKPIGGKWTYDTENRLKFPKTGVVPLLDVPPQNDYVREAQLYVDENFAHNYGNTASPFGNLGGFYPTTHHEAEYWLNNFLNQRLHNFGVYEDAMVANESFYIIRY